MSPRRLHVAVLSAAVLVLLAAGMSGCSRGREKIARKGSGPSGTVSLLRERAEVASFTAPDLAGRPVSTASLRGKVVLVNFWATWCPPCREEIPDLIALQAKYKDTLQIIGIAQDSGSIEDVRKFAADHGMNYPTVLSTPEIERLFPAVSALPTTFVLDRDGRLAQKHVGMLNAERTELETLALSGAAPDIVVTDAEDEDKVRAEEAKARVKNAAQANKIPGVDLAALSPEARAKVLEQLNSEHCTCGCGLTLAQCRIDDPTCSVSLPLAQALVKKIAAAPSR
jgi:thiol-disulfide isomerase/thioredoxin